MTDQMNAAWFWMDCSAEVTPGVYDQRFSRSAFTLDLLGAPSLSARTGLPPCSRAISHRTFVCG